MHVHILSVNYYARSFIILVHWHLWYADAMTEKPKRGRPPLGDKAASKNLGQVRVTEDQIESYGEAAKLKGESLAAWVKRNLDRIAKRDLKQ